MVVVVVVEVEVVDSCFRGWMCWWCLSAFVSSIEAPSMSKLAPVPGEIMWVTYMFADGLKRSTDYSCPVV